MDTVRFWRCGLYLLPRGPEGLGCTSITASLQNEWSPGWELLPHLHGKKNGDCPPELRGVGLTARPDHKVCPGAQEAKIISLLICKLLGFMEPTGSDREDRTLLRYAGLS